MCEQPLTAIELSRIRERGDPEDLGRLCDVVERLKVENARLHGLVSSLARRTVAQAEILGRRAERADAPPEPVAGYLAAGEILDAIWSNFP